MTLNASKEHFSIGNVAKLRCDMGYVVNDPVNIVFDVDWFSIRYYL